MIQKIYSFLTRDVWAQDLGILKRPYRIIFELLRVAVIVAERIVSGRYALRASGLTYSTLLSLVPFLALAFSVAKGFGAQDVLEPILKTYLAAGQEQIAQTVVEYVNRTDVKALGAVGLLFMLVSVVMVIGSAENAFNDIWGVSRDRPWARKFADYLSVIIIFPILLLAASGLTATLSSESMLTQVLAQAHLEDVFLMMLRLARYAAVWLAFTFIYAFLPNTKVRVVPAVAGGIVAGSAWLFAQWGYVHFQVGVSRYNAIYGTFAAFPIFLVWLYLSWVIVLLGAELVHAMHIVHGETRERLGIPLSPRDRRRLALRLVVAEAARLDAGEPPRGETALIEKLGGLSARQVRSVLDALDKSQIFQAMELASGEFTYILRQSPDHIKVIEMLDAFERVGQAEEPLPEAAVDQWLKGFEQKQRSIAEGLTLRDLAILSAMAEGKILTEVLARGPVLHSEAPVPST